MQQPDLIPANSLEHQTYKFEFISDREKFTTTFKGFLSETDIINLLKTLQTHLYCESPDVVWKYIMEHSPGYSCFHAEKT